MLAFFDFLAFWYLVDVLALVMFAPNSMPLLQTASLFVLGYLSRPLGGWIIGRYGDNKGRKVAVRLSLIGLSFCTMMIAFLPTYQDVGNLAIILFILIRLGQGMALGAQFPALWVHLIESLPTQNIGIGCGIITAAAMFGGLLLSTMLTIMEGNLSLNELLTYGWRLPFLIGGIAGLGLIFLSRRLGETPVFITHQTQIQTQQKHTLLQGFFCKKRWIGALSVLGLSWLIASVVVVIVFLLDDLVVAFFPIHYSIAYVGSLITLLFLIIGCIFFGFMTDITNAAKVLALGSIFFMIAIFMLFYDLTKGGQMLFFSFALTGFGAGVIGAIPAIMTRICPAQYRLSTVSICYNAIYALVGGFLPLILGYFTFSASFAPALYLSFVCVLMIFLSFYLYYFPQTQEELYKF